MSQQGEPASSVPPPTSQAFTGGHDVSAVNDHLGVRVQDGTLTIAPTTDSFRAVMEEIGRQATIEMRFIGEGDHPPLTESFVELPLNEALTRLVRNRNFVFVYTQFKPEKKIGKIILLPGSGGRFPHLDLSATASFYRELQEAMTPELIAEAVNEALATKTRINMDYDDLHTQITDQLNSYLGARDVPNEQQDVEPQELKSTQ